MKILNTELNMLLFFSLEKRKDFWDRSLEKKSLGAAAAPSGFKNAGTR